MDFGMWPEEFKEEAFNEYISPLLNSDKETDGVFAPWMMFKKDYLSTTQHDPIMHSCREDSDLFNSLTLLGYTFKQKWNSLVYHLAGRGAGSFSQDKGQLNCVKKFLFTIENGGLPPIPYNELFEIHKLLLENL